MSRLACSLAILLAFGGNASARDNEIPKEAREAFAKATECELYSIDPARLPEKNDEAKKADLFHGWKILGKTTLKGDDVKKVRAAIEKGAKDSDGSVAGCFNPRHGVRIVHDKKTYDLVICYECLSATVYSGEERIGSFLTSHSPGKTLNKVLSDAKVPLPKE
jgi:hypothetical protein